jgi:hypothetical protein
MSRITYESDQRRLVLGSPGTRSRDLPGLVGYAQPEDGR